MPYWVGNKSADFYARKGADCHPREKPKEKFRKLRENAVPLTLRCVLRILRLCQKGGWKDVEQVSEERPSRGPHLILSEDGGHVIHRFQGRWVCGRCGDSRARRGDLARAPCLGDHKGVREAHPSHKLWRTGPMMWCHECAAKCVSSGAFMIAKPCLGRPPLGSARHFKRRYLILERGLSGEKVGNGFHKPVPIFGNNDR